ncbi:MAG: WYL domain-containing protein [Candidatus Izemoplasmatales bacterium]|nr:WYL domain-containing protein [Candidatus Izemoplasmatales bacterium]
MPVQKNQMLRLTHFVGMLKENRYPNCFSFARELRRWEDTKKLKISCSIKTIQRDIKVLKDEFNCPMEYDYLRKGYYLIHHGWNFSCPAILCEHEMIASVLGARIAEEIFPEPLKSDIRNAVDFQLSANNPDFLDKAFVRSLTLIPGLKISIDAEVFMNIFHCWQNHEAVNITYEDADGKRSDRMVEPHALVYYDRSWYVKGFCLKRNQRRTFAIHRIVAAAKSGKYFEPDEKIISSTTADNFLEYNRIENVKILCHKSIKSFLAAKPLHTEQIIEKVDNEHFSVLVPSVPEPEIIHWVLYQAGLARVLEPMPLKKMVKTAAKKIMQEH